MKKYLLVSAALACCSAIAQAGIVKDYFYELCAQTEIEPKEITNSPMANNAADDGVEHIKVANMTEETYAKAMALVESWDTSKLVADISQEDTTMNAFAEPIENTDKAECLIMIKEGTSPLVFVLVEGNTQILKSLNPQK